jgi:hypothetical protein
MSTRSMTASCKSAEHLGTAIAPALEPRGSALRKCKVPWQVDCEVPESESLHQMPCPCTVSIYRSAFQATGNGPDVFGAKTEAQRCVIRLWFEARLSSHVSPLAREMGATSVLRWLTQQSGRSSFARGDSLYNPNRSALLKRNGRDALHFGLIG